MSWHIDYFGACCACVRLLVLGQLWEFSAIISLSPFPGPPSSSCSCAPKSECQILCWVPEGPRGPVHLLSVCFLCHSDWGISIVWSGNSLVLSSVLSILLLSPSTEFFKISVFVFSGLKLIVSWGCGSYSNILLAGLLLWEKWALPHYLRGRWPGGRVLVLLGGRGSSGSPLLTLLGLQQAKLPPSSSPCDMKRRGSLCAMHSGASPDSFSSLVGAEQLASASFLVWLPISWPSAKASVRSLGLFVRTRWYVQIANFSITFSRMHEGTQSHLFPWALRSLGILPSLHFSESPYICFLQWPGWLAVPSEL